MASPASGPRMILSFLAYFYVLEMMFIC